MPPFKLQLFAIKVLAIAFFAKGVLDFYVDAKFRGAEETQALVVARKEFPRPTRYRIGGHREYIIYSFNTTVSEQPVLHRKPIGFSNWRYAKGDRISIKYVITPFGTKSRIYDEEIWKRGLILCLFAFALTFIKEEHLRWVFKPNT